MGKIDRREPGARVNVTKTSLPPIEEYFEYVRTIWDNAWLTNQGPLLKDFEREVKKHLAVKDFHFVGNGTIALQVALKALGIESGEVITTPFSYVATTSAILWERCAPIFVDIDPDTFCIDANKIEQAITEKTKAILAVHVFGHPCDVEAIEKIANKHNLKVIYDGAHAFNVKYKGRSLLSYGDISTCSFHATKLFNTIEGGALIAKDEDVSKRIEFIKQFGHAGDEHVMLGINAKASEFQAAMGLCNLKYIDEYISSRKHATELYNTLLKDNFIVSVPNEFAEHNYAYYPIVFATEKEMYQALECLNKENIFPRRYFFPSLNTLPYVKKQKCPISESISSRILCLPLYASISDETVKKIAGIINGLR